MNLNGLLLGFFNEPKKTLAIVLFVLSALLFVLQILPFFQPQNPLSKAVVLSARPEETINKSSPVFQASVFGKYQAVLTDADIKESSLDLEIVGIMFSADSQSSQVLIRSSGGEERVYSQGSALPGGAEIRKINKNGIVVFYRGALESLSLPKNELLFDKPPKPLVGE